ncbi:hypothetical protein GIB67_025878 [Kingdonia uniflora]|uniref:Uncharacterized protein n=1 Tax=Kingdonia uniflora TaxID=39325 RepID=A0A7J7MDI6_9MAGN|nr:hypothetical protein GIB67_025878 [Kingdonia uniflora]
MKIRVREREISTDDSITTKGGKDKRKAVTRSLKCKLREEAEIEEVLKKWQKLSKLVWTNAVDSHLGAEGINCKVSRKESFIDTIAREGTELEAVLKELEISRFKRVASKDDKLNEMLDGPVDMATVSSTVVQNLEKRKAVKRVVASCSVTSNSVDDSSKRRKVTSPIKLQVVLEENDKIAEGADLRPRFEVEAGLLEDQCRAKAREKIVAIVDDEFKKFACALRVVQLGFQDRSIEMEKRISQLEEGKN